MEKNTRVFDIDGEKYRFATELFNEVFDAESEKRGLSLRDLEELVSEKAFVTRDAVHNWRLGRNGPGDSGTVAKIAEALDCDIFTILEKSGTDERPLTERQIRSFKRIYNDVQRFLVTFELECAGAADDALESDGGEPVREYVSQLHSELNRVTFRLILEYFDLRNTELYGTVCEIWNGFTEECRGILTEMAELSRDETEEKRNFIGVLKKMLFLVRDVDADVCELVEKYVP